MYSLDTLNLPREEKADKKNKLTEESKKNPATLINPLRKKTLAFINAAQQKREKMKDEPKFKKTKPVIAKNVKPGVSVLNYCEALDLLISGYEDSRICIWGYNEESEEIIPQDFQIEGQGNDQVSNRVSGLSLKQTFMDHRDVVTCLATVTDGDNCWLISSGWDRRICVWDLKNHRLVTVFCNDHAGYGKEELAADGLILDLEFCQERKEFAYASADKQAYIRKFSTKGSEMTLIAVLQGHDAEVTQVLFISLSRDQMA
jgi:WD40 repeat protein